MGLDEPMFIYRILCFVNNSREFFLPLSCKTSSSNENEIISVFAIMPIQSVIFT